MNCLEAQYVGNSIHNFEILTLNYRIQYKATLLREVPKTTGYFKCWVLMLTSMDKNTRLYYYPMR